MDNKIFEKLLNEVKQSGKPVYIYGMDHLAEAVIVGMYLSGIEPEAGFDREPKKEVLGRIFGVPIYQLSELWEKSRDAYVFVTVAYDFGIICSKLRNKGFKHVYDVIGFLNTFKVSDYATNHDRHAYNPFVADIEIYASGKIADFHSSRISESKPIILHDTIEKYETITQHYTNAVACANGEQCRFIHTLLLITGTKCHNRCVDCCADLQYFEHNIEFSVEKLKNSLARIFNDIEYIGTVNISGSEPFMHKNLVDIVRLLRSYKQINRISISTTGNIIPDNEVLQALSESKITAVNMSDYGNDSPNQARFIEKARANLKGTRVSVATEGELIKDDSGKIVEKSAVWLDNGDMTKRNYNNEILNSLQDGCKARQYLILRDGKLYQCWRSMAVQEVGVIQPIEGECLDILNPELSKEEFSRQLQLMINLYKPERPPLRACDHCNGFWLSKRRVPVAVQVDHKLSPYEKTENPSICSPETDEFYLKRI